MRRLVYYIGTSLDGRIAGPAGEVDFYPVGDGADAAAYQDWINQRYPETVPTQYRSPAGLVDVPNGRFDTVVMGLGTYRVVRDQGVSSPYGHLHQYVVSRSIARIEELEVELARDAIALVRRLKREDGRDLWLCGGGRLAGVLLPEIDELIIKRYPVLAGAGPALVDGDFRPTEFTATDSRAFSNGVGITWFERRAEPA